MKILSDFPWIALWDLKNDFKLPLRSSSISIELNIK
jgi:hypothetical protein